MAYQSKLEDDFTNDLFGAILALKDSEECYRFFEDICTVGELKSLAQRFAVAKMLMKENTYSDIASCTGASTATISRVKRYLNYGANGYKLILERLNGK